MSLLVAIAVFGFAYLLNITWISVFYHRALAHRALVLSPRTARFVVRTGPWITGMDPLAWVCMHRLHHVHSDTAQDPHSPVHAGIFGVLFAQLRSYRRTLAHLLLENPKYTRRVRDLDFGVSWTNRYGLWLLPYVVHAAIALAVAIPTGWWLVGAAYWFGMMSHPIQGWLVNSFGHAVGGRNFEVQDNSRNNLLIGLLVAGEGYQNNHHAFPASARFGFKPLELDFGWPLCRLVEQLGLGSIRRDLLLPTPAEWEARQRVLEQRRASSEDPCSPPLPATSQCSSSTLHARPASPRRVKPAG